MKYFADVFWLVAFLNLQVALCMINCVFSMRNYYLEALCEYNEVVRKS